MEHETLMECTRRLIRESDQSLPEIYVGLVSNGSSVTFFWLRKFAAGGIKDPSVNRVEEVYKYLTKKKSVFANIA